MSLLHCATMCGSLYPRSTHQHTDCPRAPDASNIMDIVITGANGAVGRALIRYCSGGASIEAMRLRALVRGHAGAQFLHALGADVIVVDYRQPETLRSAVAGADAAVHLAGALLPRRGETLLQANAETTRAVVEAATSAGVKTLV